MTTILTVGFTFDFTGDLTNDLKEKGNQDTGKNASLNDSIKELAQKTNPGEKSNHVLSLDELEKILMKVTQTMSLSAAVLPADATSLTVNRNLPDFRTSR